MTFLRLAIGILLLATTSAYAGAENPIELTNGYFQIQNSEPRHLIDTSGKTFLRLADEYQLWLHFFGKGENNPCSEREQTGCTLLHELVSKSEDGKEAVSRSIMWQNVRMDAGAHFSVSFSRTVSRATPYGDAVIRILIVKYVNYAEQTVFLYEIPVVIN